MKGFLEYVPGDSLLHKMNPVAKLAVSLLIIFACFITQSFVALIAILVLDYAFAAHCKMMPQTVGLTKAVAGFSAILALIALFTVPAGAVLAPLPWGYIGTGSIPPATKCASCCAWSPADSLSHLLSPRSAAATSQHDGEGQRTF